MRGLVDLDPMLYAAGFAVQHKRWAVTGPDGACITDFRCKRIKNQQYSVIDKTKVTVHQGKSLKEVKSHMELLYPVSTGYVWEEYLFVEPLQNALFALNSLVKGNVKDSGCDTHTCFLDGPGNFRAEVATLQKYKGNRDGIPKPEYYHQLRQYAVDYLNALVACGIETDDALSMEQRADPHNTVIITIDKDLEQVPGPKYYYNRKVKDDPSPGMFYVSEERALRTFYEQLITGDRTDNIPGLGGTVESPGIGKGRAEKIVAQHEDLRALQAHILQLYTEKYGETYTYENWHGQEQTKTALEVMTEVGQLIWMQRWAGDMWSPSFIEGFTNEQGQIIPGSLYL